MPTEPEVGGVVPLDPLMLIPVPHIPRLLDRVKCIVEDPTKGRICILP